MNNKQVMLTVFEKLHRGVHVVVVREDDGTLDVIPSAYLNDISYTGSRDVVVTFEDEGDFGSAFDINDESSWDDMAEWAIKNFLWRAS